MKLMTEAQRKKLIQNYQKNCTQANDPVDFYPVLKLFSPIGGATWLLTELDEDGDTLFGLCDLGLGYTEIGCVSLRELATTKLPLGLKIERDRGFKADKTLHAYAEEAQRAGRITA